MGQGKLGRGTQQQHKKATPHSSYCQNEQQTTGRVDFLHIYDTRGTYQYPAGILVLLLILTKCKKSYFFLFVYLMLVYLPRLGISEIRDTFFRGLIWTIPIWIVRLVNSDSVCVGQVPGTSHVATRPKKHTRERRICPSLSWPFICSRPRLQFVRGCPKRP